MKILLRLRDFYKKNTPYFMLFVLIVFLALSLRDGHIFQNGFSKIMNAVTYLIWHNTIEIASIIIAIAVFFISYYTYEMSKNFRALFMGCILLLMAFIDYFHVLSFKGMPDFLSFNVTNKATTYWVIARLIGGIGFFVAGLLPIKVKFKVRKIYFFIVPLFISIAVLIPVSFFPKVIPPMFIDGTGLTEAKKLIEYVIIFLNLGAAFLFLRIYLKTKEIYNFVLACALIIGAFSELAFTFYEDIYDIYNYLGHIYKFIMYFIIFRVIFIRSIRQPFYELREARDQIKNYADNQDLIVEQRTHQINEKNKKLLEDLEYARGIQMSMMPQSLPKLKRVTFEAGYFPAEMVGGDFYNIVRLDYNKIGIYIGDVSGHGVSAAMLTVFVNQSIKMTSEDTPGIFEIMKPSEVLKELNLSYNKTNFKEDIYLVMFYGIYDLETMEFTYASAGMNVSPMVIELSGEVFDMDIKGFPICKLQEYNSEGYKDTIVRFKSGEKILFYTDGLVDGENEGKHVFSETRLKNILKRNATMNAIEITNSITSEVKKFIEKKELHDDITYFIMEVK
ncbi:MAG: MASE3 domain-containing protein [Clostridia bacterium]